MILHIDCNNFFCSCHLAIEPHLKGKPAIVANVNENGGGIVLALNNEAKKLNFKRGDPVFKIRKRVEKEGVTIIPVEHNLYKQVSDKIMSLVKEQELVLDFVQYSVDEFFGYMPLEESDEMIFYTSKVRDLIQSQTGIPVSCGCAQTYTLAKVATHFAKRYSGYNGICCITSDKREKALSLIAIEEVWGIGREMRKMAAQLGIKTALDFAQKEGDYIQKFFRTQGHNTWKELNGYQAIELANHEMQKSIMQSATFAYMHQDYTFLEQKITEFVAACTQKLCEQKGLCRSVVVFVATNRHREDLLQYHNSARVLFSTQTNNRSTILKAAKQLLKEIYRPNYQYKKAGVILGNITHSETVELNLFDADEQLKNKRITDTITALNKQFGKNIIQIGKEDKG